MSIAKHFSMESIKSKLKNIKRGLGFKDVLRLAMYEIFPIRTNYARLDQIFPTFPYLKHLQAIGPLL